MVAYAPYIASTASLSSLFYAPSPVAPPNNNAASLCEIATVTVTEYATARPTTTNSHGHGGPYFNPYNDLPLPFTWPGRPTNGETTCSLPIPTPPYEYGGPAKQAYEAPAWIPRGVNKLVPSLPKGEQNGNSYWGELDCPHLPIDGLPGSSSNSSYGSHSSGPYPTNPGSGYGTGSSSVPYPTSDVRSPYPSISGSASYSGNTTKTTGIYPTGTGISTPTPNCPTMPETGVTRTYDLHVAYQTIAPDGIPRNGLTINGQFPGPLVEANWYARSISWRKQY